MKKFFAIPITLLLLFFVSCKKGYTCACSNEDGFYDGFDIHDTKKRATKKCNDYELQYSSYNETQDSIPVSPVHCDLLKGE